MLFTDPSLNNSPPFITLASRGTTILAHAHYEDHGSALQWCGRAMTKVHDAEQICIAKPTLVHWEPFGTVPAPLPIEGWRRAMLEWEPMDPRQLLRCWESAPGELRTLNTEPPRCPSQPPLASRIHHATTPTPRPEPVPTLGNALTLLTAVLERLLERMPTS